MHPKQRLQQLRERYAWREQLDDTWECNISFIRLVVHPSCYKEGWHYEVYFAGKLLKVNEHVRHATTAKEAMAWAGSYAKAHLNTVLHNLEHYGVNNIYTIPVDDEEA